MLCLCLFLGWERERDRGASLVLLAREGDGILSLSRLVRECDGLSLEVFLLCLELDRERFILCERD